MMKCVLFGFVLGYELVPVNNGIRHCEDVSQGVVIVVLGGTRRNAALTSANNVVDHFHFHTTDVKLEAGWHMLTAQDLV